MPIQPETLHVARDARGFVFEPLQAPDFHAQQNIHVVVTRPGEIRGNHFHRHATEILAAVGPVLVRVRSEGVLQDFQVPEGEVWRFTIPPGMPHAIQQLGDAPGTIVSFSTRPHDPSHPDTHREVLI